MRLTKITVTKQKTKRKPLQLEFSPWFFRLFHYYLHWRCRGAFTAIRCLAPPVISKAPTTMPVVVYANHPSWWDPIHFIWLHARYFSHSAAFGPMAAQQLQRYQFFKKLGLYPVATDSAAGLRSFLSITDEVLSAPNRTLWLTAAGHFSDPRQIPLTLQPGLAHIAKRVSPLCIVPLAIEYPFWNQPRPEALSAFGEPILIQGNEQLTTSSWNQLFSHKLEITQQLLTEAALSRDARLFETIYSGKKGISLAYDGLAWLKARCRGQGFQRQHGE